MKHFIHLAGSVPKRRRYYRRNPVAKGFFDGLTAPGHVIVGGHDYVAPHRRPTAGVGEAWRDVGDILQRLFIQEGVIARGSDSDRANLVRIHLAGGLAHGPQAPVTTPAVIADAALKAGREVR